MAVNPLDASDFAPTGDYTTTPTTIGGTALHSEEDRPSDLSGGALAYSILNDSDNGTSITNDSDADTANPGHVFAVITGDPGFHSLGDYGETLDFLQVELTQRRDGVGIWNAVPFITDDDGAVQMCKRSSAPDSAVPQDNSWSTTYGPLHNRTIRGDRIDTFFDENGSKTPPANSLGILIYSDLTGDPSGGIGTFELSEAKLRVAHSTAPECTITGPAATATDILEDVEWTFDLSAHSPLQQTAYQVKIVDTLAILNYYVESANGADEFSTASEYAEDPLVYWDSGRVNSRSARSCTPGLPYPLGSCQVQVRVWAVTEGGLEQSSEWEYLTVDTSGLVSERNTYASVETDQDTALVTVAAHRNPFDDDPDLIVMERTETPERPGTWEAVATWGPDEVTLFDRDRRRLLSIDFQVDDTGAADDTNIGSHTDTLTVHDPIAADAFFEAVGARLYDSEDLARRGRYRLDLAPGNLGLGSMGTASVDVEYWASPLNNNADSLILLTILGCRFSSNQDAMIHAIRQNGNYFAYRRVDGTDTNLFYSPSTALTDEWFLMRSRLWIDQINQKGWIYGEVDGGRDVDGSFEWGALNLTPRWGEHMRFSASGASEWSIQDVQMYRTHDSVYLLDDPPQGETYHYRVRAVYGAEVTDPNPPKLTHWDDFDRADSSDLGVTADESAPLTWAGGGGTTIDTGLLTLPPGGSAGLDIGTPEARFRFQADIGYDLTVSIGARSQAATGADRHGVIFQVIHHDSPFDPTCSIELWRDGELINRLDETDMVGVDLDPVVYVDVLVRDGQYSLTIGSETVTLDDRPDTSTYPIPIGALWPPPDLDAGWLDLQCSDVGSTDTTIGHLEVWPVTNASAVLAQADAQGWALFNPTTQESLILAPTREDRKRPRASSTVYPVGVDTSVVQSDGLRGAVFSFEMVTESTAALEALTAAVDSTDAWTLRDLHGRRWWVRPTGDHAVTPVVSAKTTGAAVGDVQRHTFSLTEVPDPTVLLEVQ